MIPTGLRRKRARCWAALYVGLFDVADEAPPVESGEEEGEQHDDGQEGK